MGLGTTELIIIFAIILMVFGAGKLPKVARDIANGIKEFKRTMSGNDPMPDTKPTDHVEPKDKNE